MEEEGKFQRIASLVGEEGMSRLAVRRVIVFGVGGVGSWCAEALIRSGIHELTIVDSDCVAESNINRQLMATTQTVGQPKVEALRQRLLTITPEAHIVAIARSFNEATAPDFHLEQYDYIVDAIDSLRDKALLILLATQGKGRLFSSMGAALKMDPTRIRTAEFWKVTGDPLARALRNTFKRQQRFPSRKFQCVYSDEHQASCALKGSVVHVTATFGLVLAGLVIDDVVRNHNV
ncbi:MAG: tRNA threonylcarbamoyladenosine dehydratase [Bacteroidaceae bacterium]|nr:tRNA threonylcarbamoyladenosine dehydratase [Bacteroidaceae bacterium]